MATSHSSARHGSHRANDDFSPFLRDSGARMRVVYELQHSIKLDGGAVVKESCFGTKRDSPQSAREGDDATVIFEVATVRRVKE